MIDTVKNKLVGDLLSHIISNLIPIDKQEACGEGKDFWCSDWWTIEVLKCLYLGTYDYNRFNPPRRLINNSNFSKNEILKAVNYKMSMMDHLERFSNDHRVLLVGEVGRGIDIVLACLIKNNWERIICYDSNYLINDVLKDFSVRHLPINVEFITASTNSYPVDNIPDNTIMVINHSRGVGNFLTCDKITRFIVDGELVKDCKNG
jgi:hypothetical protein